MRDSFDNSAYSESLKCAKAFTNVMCLFSVDAETDDLMQQLIREQWSSCTVIFIAHRLDTIMSCDRTVMLEQGSIVDCGPPQDLLARGKDISAFARFVEGERSAEQNN